jgi:hypothetical protein
MKDNLITGSITDSISFGKISDRFSFGVIDEVFKYVTPYGFLTGIPTEDGFFRIVQEDGQLIIPE